MRTGRLSTFAAALVIARRDFSALLWSRSFIFFLLGPLFMAAVTLLSSHIGNRVEQQQPRPLLGVAMTPADTQAMLEAARNLGPALGAGTPGFAALDIDRGGPAAALREGSGANRNLAAVVTGTPAAPVLTGTPGLIQAWRPMTALIAARAASGEPHHLPEVALRPTASSGASRQNNQTTTAQAAQALLFLLTMLLAGMVLSNLVEEKANKIIEILAAAIPMDAVFLGKLFAMLAVSLTGIAVWGAAGIALALARGQSLGALTEPAVGWPAFILLGVAYFSMAYLLLGSVFLTIGSMATTVREVQTLSMPVTMLQLLVFFFASFAVSAPGSGLELAAVLIPFSSPYAMLARATHEPGLLQHGLALLWQATWVGLFIRQGARLFRRLVLQSGPQKSWWRKRRGRA